MYTNMSLNFEQTIVIKIILISGKQSFFLQKIKCIHDAAKSNMLAHYADKCLTNCGCIFIFFRVIDNVIKHASSLRKPHALLATSSQGAIAYDKLTMTVLVNTTIFYGLAFVDLGQWETRLKWGNGIT